MANVIETLHDKYVEKLNKPSNGGSHADKKVIDFVDQGSYDYIDMTEEEFYSMYNDPNLIDNVYMNVHNGKARCTFARADGIDIQGANYGDQINLYFSIGMNYIVYAVMKLDKYLSPIGKGPGIVMTCHETYTENAQ